MLLLNNNLVTLLLLASTVLATPTRSEKLDARTNESLDGTVYCGIFGSGDRTDASGLLTDLDAGANGKISKKGFIIPSGQCNRVTCWDTTGIYACNVSPSRRQPFERPLPPSPTFFSISLSLLKQKYQFSD